MRILLVRTDGIGDALACAPLVAALRDAGHGVGALVSTRSRDAFARDAFAALHVVERIPWPRHGSTPASRAYALAEARACAYDVALVASEESEAYAFARDAGIATRVGFINGWQKPFKTLRVARRLTRAIVRPAAARDAREHEVSTLFRLGDGLHGEDGPTTDVTRLRSLVLDTRREPHDRIAVNVSAKLATSGLDGAAFVAIVRALAAQGFPSLVLGEDPALVATIARASGGVASPSLGTRAWKASLAGARAAIAVDSGAAHVAGMVGVPCVDLFGPGPAVACDVVRWRPWAAPWRARVLDPTRDARELAAAVASDVVALASSSVRRRSA